MHSDKFVLLEFIVEVEHNFPTFWLSKGKTSYGTKSQLIIQKLTSEGVMFKKRASVKISSESTTL